jgi:hypothetical protein
MGVLTPAPARNRVAVEIDLALVLAVDVSTSMDADEQELQRRGYVEAFRSPSVHRAIVRGATGRIAVAYMEWAGAHPRFQNVVVPWTILESPADSIAFADRLAGAPVHRVAGTSIAEAIAFGSALLSSGDFLAARRVIDLSGDGANNQGPLVTQARDEAVARGITINGLPIMLKSPDRRENAMMDAYYRDCVIGGPDAFMIPVRRREQFLTETRSKIVREIAGAAESGPPVQPARVAPPTDCDTSESLWDDPGPEPLPPGHNIGREL